MMAPFIKPIFLVHKTPRKKLLTVDGILVVEMIGINRTTLQGKIKGGNETKLLYSLFFDNHKMCLWYVFVVQ